MLDSVKNDRSRGLLMRPTNAWLTDGGPAFGDVADDNCFAVAAVVAVKLRREPYFGGWK